MLKGIFYEDFDNSYIPNILAEIYMDRVYDRFLAGKKDLVILDIGANIGITSNYFSNFAKRIIAVEPAKEHCDTMLHMLNFNNVNNVEVVQAAIGKDDTTSTLFHNNNKTMFSLSEVVKQDGQNDETVNVMRLDTLFAQKSLDHVDFMKLDIEGAECEVIGGEGFKKVADKIDSMLIEYHAWSGRNPSHITTVLSDYGFKVEHIPSKATIFGAYKR